MSCDMQGIGGSVGELGWFDDFLEDAFSGQGKNCSSGNFHEKIFVQQEPFVEVKKTRNVSYLSQTKGDFFFDLQGTPLAYAKGSAEAGIEATWGGKKGVEVSGYAKGSVKDNKGNKLDVKVEQHTDGTGKLKASVSHEINNNPPPKEKKKQ